MPLKSDLYTSQNAKTVFMSSMCLLVEDCHVDPNIWQKVLFEWRLSDVVTTMNTNGEKGERTQITTKYTDFTILKC